MAIEDTFVDSMIYEGLMSHVDDTARSMVPNPLRVSAPDIAFDAEIDETYLVVSYLPNTQKLDGLAFDSDRTFTGLLQISVKTPEGLGLVQIFDLASQVAFAFKAGTMIVSGRVVVHVDEEPMRAPPQQESDRVHVPVTVRWRAEVPPTE